MDRTAAALELAQRIIGREARRDTLCSQRDDIIAQIAKADADIATLREEFARMIAPEQNGSARRHVVKPGTVVDRVLNVITAAAGRTVDAGEILAALADDTIDVASIRSTLIRLHQSEQIERYGRGKYRVRTETAVPQPAAPASAETEEDEEEEEQ